MVYSLFSVMQIYIISSISVFGFRVWGIGLRSLKCSFLRFRAGLAVIMLRQPGCPDPKPKTRNPSACSFVYRGLGF